ncbi:MAG: hypothetical protein KAI29_32165 [Cyclobacteriaceae bacterium]|nr:hypothetical protein [Cyclobacteriaceae bacterium]
MKGYYVWVSFERAFHDNRKGVIIAGSVPASVCYLQLPDLFRHLSANYHDLFHGK